MTTRSAFSRTWERGLALALALAATKAVAAPLVPLPGWHPAVVQVEQQRALLLRPDRPRGTIVMLPGGTGAIGLDPGGTITEGSNFTIRTAPLWLARGYALLIPDAPGGRNLRGQRATTASGRAVAALVAEAHRAVAGPVFLLGTSQGSIAAVDGAAAGDVAGVVLSESVSRPGRRSEETVFDAHPERVTAPVLIVANAADACPVAPPEDAPRIAAALTRSAGAAAMTVDGGTPGGRDCGSLSPHGYAGIESEVVGRIADWLDQR